MGLGVSDLWFDNPSPRIAIYASGINAPLPIPWIEQMLERGVKLFKLKLGFGRDEDLKNLREMKEILGNNAALAVDANRAWDFAYAKYWVKALAEYNVRWLEEPLRPAEEKHYPALHQISTIPLAAGENAWCLPGQEVHDFDRLDVDIWQPDLTKNCGPSQALQLIKHAQTKGRQVLPHYLGSAVGQAISLHMAAGCEEPLMEWDINPSKLRTDFFRGGFEIRDGCIQLPASPGLGWQWDDPEDDKVRG
jgi:L-alanine-DL-glutamate epimerase-like enolase superfamily enzyme